MKIVLVHPEIPPNTGSIGRLCAATDSQLVLVEPLGFSLEDRYLKRAGLDYWPWIDVKVVSDWPAALDPERPIWLFTARAERSYTDVTFTDDAQLVFGAESVGLPDAMRAAYPAERHLRIPIDNPKIRSLNLAQCAAIAIYEARRQIAAEAP